MDIAVKSHVGHIRQINEDCGEVIQRAPQTQLAIVADGMGGHQAGDVASRMAVDYISNTFQTVDIDKNVQKWEDWLLNTIQEANQHIIQYAQEYETYQGMGTTVVVALLLPECYLIAHVGDSRVYRYQHEKIERITEDHSLVNELVKEGQITREEAELHPQRNVITRALGTDTDVEVDIKTLFYMPNEQILLCSDGLSNMLTDHEIQEILASDQGVEDKANNLLQIALDAGGDDNITIILIHNEEESHGE